MEDSNLGLRPGKTHSVESEVKEIKPFAPLYLSGDEGYPAQAGM
jgi:hypothetical protein